MLGVLVLAVGWAASILFLMIFFTRLAWASPSMAVGFQEEDFPRGQALV